MFSLEKIAFLLLLLMSACQPTESSYKITVKSSLDVLDKQKVLLLVYNENNSVEVLSEKVMKHQKVVFEGEIKEPKLGKLYVELESVPYVTPIVIEEGNIYVQMDSTTILHGTELNDKLHQLLLDKDDFCETFSEEICLSEARLKLKEFYDSKLPEVSEMPALATYIEQQLNNL